MYSVALPIQFIKFLFILFKYKPDIVFFHNSIQSTLPLILSKIFKIKQRIYFNHGVTYLGYKGFLRHLFLNIEKLNAILSDFTITVSKDMKNILDEIKPNTKIIHNGSACGLDIKNIESIKNKKIKKRKISRLYRKIKKRKGSLVLVEIVNHFKNRNDIEFIFVVLMMTNFIKFQNQYQNVKTSVLLIM